MSAHYDIFWTPNREKVLLAMSKSEMLSQLRMQITMLVVVTQMINLESDPASKGTSQRVRDYVRCTMRYLEEVIPQIDKQEPGILTEDDKAGAQVAIKAGRSWLDKAALAVVD